MKTDKKTDNIKGKKADLPPATMTLAWLRAMRIHTLPASISGVLAGVAAALLRGHFDWLPALLCLLFAVTAQIGCNFANEYYDYRDGIDKKGRAGFRRGVTEGDITPVMMHRATAITFLTAAIIGCSLIYWGGWWLIFVGIIVMLGALSYSAGPFPLSRNALGEIAVVVFYGLIPVSFTFYLQTGYFSYNDFLLGLAVGLMAANIMIINNYRDYDDDLASGKLTTAIVFGRNGVATAYLVDGIIAVACTLGVWLAAPVGTFIFPAGYLAAHIALWIYLRRHDGSDLNRALAMTAMLMLVYTLAMTVVAAAVYTPALPS